MKIKLMNVIWFLDFALVDTLFLYVTDPDNTAEELRPKEKEILGEFKDFDCDKEAADITLVNGSLI